jgi:adenylate kinase
MVSDNGKVKTVLLFGAPGCGKGTQGKMLGTLPGFFHLACGDVFRALDLSSDLGKVFLKYSSKGELVPDDVTVQLWREHLNKLIHAGTFKPAQMTLVLDGIPRNVQQAKILSEDIEVTKVFLLGVGKKREVLVQRLKSRALKDNRLDDANEATIRHRLDVYERDSKPVINFYPRKIQAKVDALRTPLEVARDLICEMLGCRIPGKPPCGRRSCKHNKK